MQHPLAGKVIITAGPKIRHLQIAEVVAEGLEHVVDREAGVIDRLDMDRVSAPGVVEAVHLAGEASIKTVHIAE